MGFFTPDEELDRQHKLAKTIKKINKVRDKKSVTGPSLGCDACALKRTWPTLKSPMMKMTGNIETGDILILGEAPGENEDLQNQQFVGESGKLLRDILPFKHTKRLAYQNIVRCHPAGNDTPNAEVVRACSIHLERDITALKPRAILGVGGTPLSGVFPGQSITDLHGLRMPVQIGSHVAWYWPILHPAFVLRMGGRKSNAYPVFRADITRFFSEVDSWDKPKMVSLSIDSIIKPKSLAEGISLLEKMCLPLSIDVETTSLTSKEIDAKLLTAAISDGNTTIAFCVDHPRFPNDWGLKLLHKAITKPWLSHNAAMELKFFLRYYPDTEPAPFDDTQALARLKYQRVGAGSLDIVSKLNLGINVKSLSDLDTKNLMLYPIEGVLNYNGLDALATRLCYDRMKNTVDKTNYQRLIRSIRAVTHMEMMGICTDQTEAKRQQEYWQAVERDEIAKAKKIYEVREFELRNMRPFNIASNSDVGEALAVHGRLPLPPKAARGGKRAWSTSEEDLLKCAPDNPLVRAVIAYREAVKMNSTYLSSVLEAPARYGTNYIHPKYTILTVRTGRMSSVDPNAQNWPKRDAAQINLRKTIIAKPEHIFVAFDYGQIEARIIACATKDKNLIRKTIAGYDVHAYWRDRALSLHPDYIERFKQLSGSLDHKKILKSARDTIKSDFVFAAFFGSSDTSISERSGLPLTISGQMLDELWQEFPGVRAWIKQQRRQYYETGCIYTLTGRVRYGIASGNEMINTPIQGSAADIMLDACSELSEMSIAENDPYLHPRVAIHDDLMFELPDDGRLLMYIERIWPVLTKVRYPWLVVPLIIEARIGTTWRDLEDFAVFEGKYA